MSTNFLSTPEYEIHSQETRLGMARSHFEAAQEEASTKGTVSDLTPDECSALGGVVKQLHDKVRGQAGVDKAEEARARIKKARSVRNAANGLYDDVHETQARLMAELRGR